MEQQKIIALIKNNNNSFNNFQAVYNYEIHYNVIAFFEKSRK